MVQQNPRFCSYRRLLLSFKAPQLTQWVLVLGRHPVLYFVPLVTNSSPVDGLALMSLPLSRAACAKVMTLRA